ncbi:hypothetical protein DDB_G0291658 [Dictyostelium discoideum AX4]|uniref:VWFA domain-containing protein n=1 Tax=Dictyostelium discoideum TaxID=44689 RepID=Q54ES2_DICDI|nr:hypothetical protein DDB_G0291658 [Dictyostelium discoideum AX4]EAL61813.1 hypothetical protein DDB_G0291658 [Dictyostelium discoideum AX4]|eukprot:XP_635168.1 hypothetical protein DDB_G0291658 [Dictyostelium discoideum AX4]
MSDKFILYTQLKNYFEYLCGGGLKLQDFLDKENRDLDDIVNCFILILGLTLASICVFNFHNYLYWPANKLPSFTVGPYHPSVFATLKNKNSLQKHKSDICKNGRFYFSFLEDGSYDAEFFIESGHSTKLKLKKIKIVKQGDKFTPDFIDLSSLVDISFRTFDKPISNSIVKGTIEMQNNGSKVSFTWTTDDNGTYSTLLPECKFSINVEGIVDGRPVKMNEVIDILTSDVINNLEELKYIKPRSFEISQKCTNYNIKSKSEKSVLLIDVSRSMTGAQLDIAKNNSKKFIAESDKFAIGAWSYSIKFFSDSWGTSSKISAANSWIDGLCSDGHTEIKQAIEEAITKFKDADEFWILCDGDTDAFPDLQSWSNFYSNNSKYIINFVGIGGLSDERMKSMVQISRGKFIKVS